MLSKISVGHYKAFEQASVDIKPITILLGANSVGKSSIIQLLLVLQQTSKAGLKSYKSALKLYGGYVNLGEPKNIFRKQDMKKTFKLTLEFKSDKLKNLLSDEFIKSLRVRFIDLPHFFPLDKSLGKMPTETKDEFELFLDEILKTFNDLRYKNLFDGGGLDWYFKRRRYDFYLPLLTEKNKKEFIETFALLEKLQNRIGNNNFSITYELKQNTKEKNLLEVSSFKIMYEDLVICELDRSSGKFHVMSDIVEITDDIEEALASEFLKDNTIFKSFNQPYFEFENEKNLPLLALVLIQIVNLFQEELHKEFSDEKINYVSPLRAHPKRYYMLDKAKVNLTLDTLDGDAIAEVLKDNKVIKNRVNEWLNRFGVEVNVTEFRQVVHQLTVKQNNVELDITDVGFGISQVLPVIIQGFLSANHTTTIIEQPEIHLHPKMQADLADLFIDIVKNNQGKKLLIETHSEYLLKRLRRRISDGSIPADYVSICLFHPETNDKGASIENLIIQDKGYFEWPEDFYGGEILKDTTEFLINQAK